MTCQMARISQLSLLTHSFVATLPSSCNLFLCPTTLVSCPSSSGCVPRLLFSNLRLRPSSLVFQPQAMPIVSCIPTSAASHVSCNSTSGYVPRLLYSNLRLGPSFLAFQSQAASLVSCIPTSGFVPRLL